MSDDIQMIFKKLTDLEKKLSTLQGVLERRYDEDKKWKTAKQAAEYLGVSVQTIYRNAHLLKGKRHGEKGDWRFKKEYLDEFQHNIIL